MSARRVLPMAAIIGDAQGALQRINGTAVNTLLAGVLRHQN
jgi:hypothetical protein